MKRFFVLIACVVLAAACQQKPAQNATKPPASPPEAAAPAAAPPTEAAATPAETSPVEITDALVTKYLEYQKEQITIVMAYYEEAKRNLESAKGDTAKTLNQIAITDRMTKELDDKLKAKQAALGMSDQELEAVRDAAAMIASGRMLYKQMGGDAQLAKMEAEQKAELAAMPADQRATAQAAMAETTRGIKDMRDGVDIRKKYGDKSTDVILKHADALASQQEEVLKLMAGKK